MYEYSDYEDYEGSYHTGDPALDREYERSKGACGYKSIPETVKSFLIKFRDVIVDNDPFEISQMYEQYFPSLTSKYFSTDPWPHPDEVDVLVSSTKKEKNHLFLMLYRELYYRHIYAHVPSGPTVDHRLKSYYNYCDLFNHILSPAKPVVLELPNQWLWEIIDEFIYQFQSYQQFRNKCGRKVVEEHEIHLKHKNVWDVLQVLNVLHSIVEKSCINLQLEVYAKGGDPEAVAGDFGKNPLYKMMGFFSLVGLLRLHSLLGDFYRAIKVLENIKLNKTSLYSRVFGCQITMFYYVGFAYMMMRRYADAIRTFSNILIYINRSKNSFQTKTYQNDQINKQTDKMYILLAMCLIVHPQRIDVTLQSALKDRSYADAVTKMSKGDLVELEEQFCFASPKFVLPTTWNPEKEEEYNPRKDPLELHCKIFIEELKQQVYVQKARSFLRLYTTVPMDKLKEYMGTTVDELENHLLCFKHKMMSVVCKKGTSGLDGEFQSESEVDFYIDLNMINIADTKVDTRYGDYFISQIFKYVDMNRSIKALQI